jgi:hypothetical protein
VQWLVGSLSQSNTVLLNRFWIGKSRATVSTGKRGQHDSDGKWFEWLARLMSGWGRESWCASDDLRSVWSGSCRWWWRLERTW